MIHRYLYDILTDGIQAFTDDPTLFDELFLENYELQESEVDAIKIYFAANGLEVINGYSRQDSKYPLVAIVLGDERESQHFIGDSAGIVEEDDDPYKGADLEASIWDHKYRLPVVTEQIDITAAYYEMVKVILLAGLEPLTDDGCFEFDMSGRDLAPDAKYLPENLFIRELSFSCQREFQRTVRASLRKKAFKTGGIHIDKSGSPSDVGGVKTLVTPYTPGDE